MRPKYIAIDPAPGKGHAVIEMCPKSRKLTMRSSVNHQELRANIEDWRQRDALIAWDAPLTGPSKPDCLTAGSNDGDFTRRKIEKLFKGDYKPPRGVSIQDYGSCCHWTITRHLLGLPRVGPYDQRTNLPFTLLHSVPRSWNGTNVVEVHPAVAIWLWLRNEPGDRTWRYKKDKTVRVEFLKALKPIWQGVVSLTPTQQAMIEGSADLLDAFVALILLVLWVEGADKVGLLGNAEWGSMLLPNDPGLHARYQAAKNGAWKF